MNVRKAPKIASKGRLGRAFNYKTMLSKKCETKINFCRKV